MTDIVINIDNLTFGDMEVIDGWGKGQTDYKDALDVLDRVVEGGVRHLSLARIRDITDAIEAAVASATDEKN